MSACLVESVLDAPWKLPLKFHQNRDSNSWDIPYIVFVWVVGGGGGGGWWSKGILGFQTLGLDLAGTKLNNIFSWAVVNSTQVELVTSKLVQVAS